MTIVQASSGLPVKDPGKLANSPNGGTVKDIQKNNDAIVAGDHYSASSANDAVVAKVLTLSINKGVDQSVRSEIKQTSEKSISDRFESVKNDTDAIFSIEDVTNNVVGFVGKALSNMASKGFDSEQLNYFRDQAMIGVGVGIDQAKIELIGIADDNLFATIDTTKDAILGGIRQLPVDASEYAPTVEEMKTGPRGTENSYGTIEVTTHQNAAVKLDFESLAFSSDRKQNSHRELFTTNSSNISFAVQGNVDESSAKQIANLVNQADSVANSFYRGNIEALYNDAITQGYSDNEMVSMARQLSKSEPLQSAMTYGEIQHMSNENTDNVAPKAVAEYLNKYLDVMESSKATLNDEKDFNEVINGIVNQMKDVQVPDLLQAINRFHAFNSKFSA